MSKQSDCEYLTLKAIEAYASRHELSIEDATEIFHKSQVVERIIIQHEYLHQVSDEEIEEFVEETVSKPAKELIVYHGSSFDFDKIDLSKSHDRRDFGRGFYTTVLEEQSRKWAYRLALRNHSDKYYVYMYAFYESPELKVKRFDTLNEEWLEFIKENRVKGGTQHDYDVVIGGVADDDTMATVQLYVAGIYTASEATERLRHSNVNNQVTFHTEKALECLVPIRRKVYATNLHI